MSYIFSRVQLAFARQEWIRFCTAPQLLMRLIANLRTQSPQNVSLTRLLDKNLIMMRYSHYVPQLY